MSEYKIGDVLASGLKLIVKEGQDCYGCVTIGIEGVDSFDRDLDDGEFEDLLVEIQPELRLDKLLKQREELGKEIERTQAEVRGSQIINTIEEK